MDLDYLSDAFLSSNTCATLISLRAENLEVLRGNINPNDFVKARFHSQDEASTKTLFQMALTISHELCHAYCMYEGGKKRIETRRTKQKPGKANFASGVNPDDCEPFFEDHRLNELGSAFQSVVFGGDMAPLGGNSTYWHTPSGTGPTVRKVDGSLQHLSRNAFYNSLLTSIVAPPTV